MRMILPADIIEVIEYPSLSRKAPIERTFRDTDAYVLGPLKIDGRLIFTTKRFEFTAGEELNVKLSTARYPDAYTIWSGIVMKWSFAYNTDVRSPDYGTRYCTIEMRPFWQADLLV